jgi:hypothetical protein
MGVGVVGTAVVVALVGAEIGAEKLFGVDAFGGVKVFRSEGYFFGVI